jgi:predicted heme/steroid binding protein
MRLKAPHFQDFPPRMESIDRATPSAAGAAHHDGSDPALPVLIAHERKVYDVTRSYPWARGSHWGDHHAGRELTGQLDPAIHGAEMLDRVPCICVLRA